jgi:hypothetical protein
MLELGNLAEPVELVLFTGELLSISHQILLELKAAIGRSFVPLTTA